MFKNKIKLNLIGLLFFFLYNQINSCFLYFMGLLFLGYFIMYKYILKNILNR